MFNRNTTLDKELVIIIKDTEYDEKKSFVPHTVLVTLESWIKLLKRALLRYDEKNYHVSFLTGYVFIYLVLDIFRGIFLLLIMELK